MKLKLNKGGGGVLDITRSLTITLSPDEIKSIILDKLKAEGYSVSDTNISFDVKTQLEGYGMGEHEVTRFRGATVKVN